jgi:hypothetical protein
MITDTDSNEIITRSDLEKLIIAYFEQYPEGPFLMPGYISFEDMIYRARRIVKIDTDELDELELERITERTNDIIGKIKYTEIIKREENAQRALLNIPHEETIIEGCDVTPDLSDDELIAFAPYGSRQPNERITIGGTCYFVNGIYQTVFIQNADTKNPMMITPTRVNITRSELERLIVAYFKQNPDGPFLRPGYISFSNMILRARRVAQVNIDQNTITQLTTLTDNIISGNRYTAIIDREERAIEGCTPPQVRMIQTQ